MYWFCFLSLECAWIKKKISLLFYPAILSNNINRFKIFTSSKKHIPGKENRQRKSEITNRNITWNKVLRVPPHFFQSLCSSHFGLTLIRVMIGLKKIRATKTFSTNHNSPAFSRAWNQQNVFASCSDWWTDRNWLPVFWLVRANQWRPSCTHFPRLEPATWMYFPWILIGSQNRLYVRCDWPDDQCEMNQNQKWLGVSPRHAPWSSHWFS